MTPRGLGGCAVVGTVVLFKATQARGLSTQARCKARAARSLVQLTRSIKGFARSELDGVLLTLQSAHLFTWRFTQFPRRRRCS